MSKLPPPIADDAFGYPIWDELQMRAYGAAVREAALEEAAQACENIGAVHIYDTSGQSQHCAAAIRALKEES